jgi:hypothetical protein
MEADYLQSVIPEPVVLLGQRLEPFSLGHAKILLRFENVYAAGIHPWTAGREPEPNLEHLLFGIFVCCQPYHQALNALRNGLDAPQSALARICRRKPRTMSYADVVQSWANTAGTFDLAEKSREFWKYIRAGSVFPRLNPGNSEARMPGAPFIQRVELELIVSFGYSEDRALNAPWGKAVQDYFAFWEHKERCEIYSTEDAEHDAEIEAINREIAAEANKANGT